MIKFIVAKLILSLAVIHSGPYTLPAVLHVPFHGLAVERVIIDGRWLDTRGQRASDVRVSAVTADGGEEDEPARYIGHDRYEADLMFGPGDTGTWYIGGITWDWHGHSGQYWGSHPSFKVEKVSARDYTVVPRGLVGRRGEGLQGLARRG